MLFSEQAKPMFTAPPPEVDGATTGDEPTIDVKDSAGLKSGKYSQKHIAGLVKAAKALGVDPYQMVAISLQESGLGTAMVKGRRGMHPAGLAQIHDFTDAQQAQVDKMARETGIDPEYLKVGIALRDKLSWASKNLGYKDEASQLQAYNGYGIITKKNFGGADKAYGMLIGNGIDLKKNPLYGKRIIQLKNDLRANKYIQSLVNQNSGGNPPLVATNSPQPMVSNK